MIQNDSLQQALIRIDHLQHQVDSLKLMSSQKVEILQSQLEQSNNTVSNLGTLSTAWGTTYAIVAVIVGLLTIVLAIATFAVPWWLKRENKESIEKLTTSFESKTQLMEKSYKSEIKTIKEEVQADLDSIKSVTNKVGVTEAALVFYTQGHAQLLSHNYAYAIYNFILSVYYWGTIDSGPGIEIGLNMVNISMDYLDSKGLKELDRILLEKSGLNVNYINLLEIINNFSTINTKSKASFESIADKLSKIETEL